LTMRGDRTILREGAKLEATVVTRLKKTSSNTDGPRLANGVHRAVVKMRANRISLVWVSLTTRIGVAGRA